MDGIDKLLKKPTPQAQKKAPQVESNLVHRDEQAIVKPSKVLLSWEAPERIFKRKPPEYYRKIAVIIIFFALLLLIIKEFLLIGVLAIVFFVVYVFNTIPPRKVKHEITTHGINYASQYVYKWNKLTNFFVEKKEGVYVLNVNTEEMFPGRIFLLLDAKTTPERISKIVNEYLSIMEIPEKTIVEQLTAKLSEKINL